MATYSVSASELKYASGSSWSSGKARQGVYSSTRYEGAINFANLANFDMSNIKITQITMNVTFMKSGGSSGKYLTLYRSAKSSISGSIASMRGNAIGSIYVSEAYNRTVTLTFNSSTNAALFESLKSYFMAGNRILITYVPSTRGTYSGGYCYDYLGISALTMTFTFDYLKSEGTLSTNSLEVENSKIATIDMDIASHSAEYSHKLQWAFGSNTYTQTVEAGETTAGFGFPPKWLEAIPSATSGTASVTLETIDASGNSLGSSIYYFTVNVSSRVKPTLQDISITPVNSNAFFDSIGEFVAGESKALIELIGVTGLCGASIVSYSITTEPFVGNANSASFTTSTLPASIRSVTVTATVVDTRGRSTTKTKTIMFNGYMPPLVGRVEAYRCTSDGTRDDVNGTFVFYKPFWSYDMIGGNTANGQVTLSQVGGNYTCSAEAAPDVALILGEGSIEPDAVYEATLTLTDSAGSVVAYVSTIASAAYIIHVKNGGKAIGIGTAAGDDETVSLGWPLKLARPLAISEGGTGATSAALARFALGALGTGGGTLTGNLYISTSLYPSILLTPTNNNCKYRAVLEGSYVGAVSLAAWEDSTGNDRRMLEIRNAAYESSLDNAVMLRNVIAGSYYAHRVFHSGMATPIPVNCGGTAAKTAKDALANLGIFFSETLPDEGEDGQICLVPV